MNCWPYSDREISAIAIIERDKYDHESNDCESIVIYSGFDFTLLSDACGEICKNGVQGDGYWWPPHTIKKIKLIVVGYEGGFREWEQECYEEMKKFRKEQLEEELKQTVPCRTTRKRGGK